MHNTIQVKAVFENMAECILQVKTNAVLLHTNKFFFLLDRFKSVDVN
jgi:hypothetical protein